MNLSVAAAVTMLTLFFSLTASSNALLVVGSNSNKCTAGDCLTQAQSLKWFETDDKAQAVWAAAGQEYPGSRSFQKWLETSGSDRRLPAFRNSLSLNCWEYVLYTALKLNAISFADAKKIHDSRTRGEKLSAQLGKLIGTAKYSPRSHEIRLIWPQDIKAGDVVFMDETSHVVQLTGQQDDQGRQRVVSFSPRPIWGDGSSETPVPGTKPQLTTVESLISELRELYPDVPSDWQSIEIKIARFER